MSRHASPFQTRLPKGRRFLPLQEQLVDRGQVGRTADQARLRRLVQSRVLSAALMRAATKFQTVGGLQ